MKVALVNPAWNYDGSIYFGCREPHLPLELGYSKAMLERDGHRVLMLDGQLQGLGNAELADQVAAFGAKMTVVATAPTYLFWRCAPPELRVPRAFLDRSEAAAAAPSPSGRTARPPREPPSPSSASTRSCAGNARRSIAELAAEREWRGIASTAMLIDGEPVQTGAVHVSRFTDHPPLAWPRRWLARHSHHHHRFDDRPRHGFGAEVEASRGCPYHCSFCAKTDFRDAYRRRDHQLVVCRDRSADRSRCRLHLLHRRDLFAAEGAARGARRARRGVRGPDPDRSVEAGAAPAARRGRLRLHRGRPGKPDGRRPRDARQALPARHRRAGRAADRRPPACAFRPGQSDRRG